MAEKPNKIPASKILRFFIDNGLIYSGYAEQIFATEKGRRLLDYLAIKYDYESVKRYEQVYQSIPEQNKDAVKIIINKSELGRDILDFQWIHTIIIPIFYNDGSPIPSQILEELKEEFIYHFGGATRYASTGDYLSPHGLQVDKCEIWNGFGTDDNYDNDKDFLRNFATKAGSKDYCNQDAVTISEQKTKTEIIDTLDMEDEISALQTSRYFSLKSMILLATIAGTDFSEQNHIAVAHMADALGYEGYK